MNTEFTQTLSLLKRGAKWGDIEVYTLEENEEILRIKLNVPTKKHHLRKLPRIVPRVLEEGEIDEDE